MPGACYLILTDILNIVFDYYKLITDEALKNET